MTDVVIAAKARYDVDEAQKNVLKLQGTVADLKKEFNKAEAGSNDQLLALRKLQAAETDLAKATDQLSSANAKSNTNFANIRNNIEGIPGPLGAATTQAKSFGQVLSVLAKNPFILVLSAIVAALTLLFNAFKKTEDGADKLEQVFAGLSSVVDVVMNRILKAGSAIVKFFTGDWSGALEDATAAVTGFADEVTSEFNRAAEAARQLQDLEDTLRDLSVARAKLNKDLAVSRELLSDENATLKQKKAALDEIKKAETDLTAQEVAAAQTRLRLAEEALASARSRGQANDELIDAAADAQKELYAIEEESAANQRKFNKQSQALTKEDVEARKKIRAEAAEKAKEAAQKLNEYENKLIQLQQENALAIIKDGYARELQALEFKIVNEKRATEKALKDGQLTRKQYNTLIEQIDISAQLQRDVLADKRNEEVKKKEEAFQKELSGIQQKIRLGGIRDQNELERAQLAVANEERLAAAIERYKDDQEKFNEVKALLDEQYRQEQEKLEEKIQLEKDKKQLEKDVAAQEKIVMDQEAAVEERLAAIDAEQAIFQEALDKKIISEEEYNQKTAALAQARIAIGEAEAAARRNTISKIADAFGTLSEIVGKQTAVGKGLAVAQATIATFQSAVSSFNSLSSIPIVGPALGAVAAAGAIASGIANVKKILKVPVPGQGGGSTPSIDSSAPSAPNISAPVAPIQQSTQIDQSQIQDLTASQSARAFIVEADIDSAQERNARLARAARLGG